MYKPTDITGDHLECFGDSHHELCHESSRHVFRSTEEVQVHGLAAMTPLFLATVVIGVVIGGSFKRSGFCKITYS